jgi:hypothetical protein
LNYLLWAFEGQYVNIGFFGQEKRYKVIRTEYNENYTYENVWFSINRTIGGVIPNDYIIYGNYQTFSGCSGSETTEKLNPDNKCVDMFIENTGTTETTFTYIDCVGSTRTYILSAGGSVNICGVYSSFKGNGLKLCPEIIDPNSCFGCVCIGYSVSNSALFGNMTVNWIDCNGLPQTNTLEPDLGISLCACEGTLTTEGGVPIIFVIGSC